MERFLFYTKDFESPTLFLKWTYLWTISSALQRRVWVQEEHPIRANVFLLFVADPGIGKSMAASIAGNELLRKLHTVSKAQISAIDGMPALIPRISFSADATSPQSLIEQLNRSTRSYMKTIITNGEKLLAPESHNSLSILLSEEATSLFRKNAEDIVTFLNQWYDARDFHYEVLSRGASTIKKVCVTLLGCTTPKNMKKLMATGLLDEGFTARCLCIYADTKRHNKAVIEINDEQKAALAHIYEHLKKVVELEGFIPLSPEAQAWYSDYYESGALEREIVNRDPRLAHYRGRIKVHGYKIMCLLHVAEYATLGPISLATAQEAIKMLREIELNMHRALASSSKNPLFDTTVEICQYIHKNGFHTKLQLLLLFCNQVNDEQLLECLKMGQMLGYIKDDIKNGKSGYIKKPDGATIEIPVPVETCNSVSLGGEAVKKTLTPQDIINRL